MTERGVKLRRIVVLCVGAVFLLGDAMNGLMAIPNLCALFLLRKEVMQKKILSRNFS